MRLIKPLCWVYSCLTGEKAILPFQQSALFSFLISLYYCGVADFMSVYRNVLSAGREEQMYEFLLKKILLIHRFSYGREKRMDFISCLCPNTCQGCLPYRLVTANTICSRGPNVVFQISKLGIHWKRILSCHPPWCPAMFHFGYKTTSNTTEPFSPGSQPGLTQGGGDQEATQCWMHHLTRSQCVLPSEDRAQPPGEFSEIPPYPACLKL